MSLHFTWSTTLRVLVKITSPVLPSSSCLLYTSYYVDQVFYHYFIGREDQSVQEQVMIRRINQQLRVNWLMFEQVDLDKVENRRLRRYLLSYLEIVTTISCVLLFRSGTPEHLAMERSFWKDMARDYPRHYQLLSSRFFGRVLSSRTALALSLIHI